jgi:hypothetical protein
MRKLFKDSDPERSNNIKLELLISKVNPSYRKDILIAKPIDFDQFEAKAQEIENNYLILQAIEKKLFFITRYYFFFLCSIIRKSSFEFFKSSAISNLTPQS